MKETTYYQIPGRDTWHWMKACQHFAAALKSGKHTRRRPRSDLCNECRAKEK